ncbi:nitroreductase family protein [Spirochaeta thermophila]|uniref:nitroreductase family protein n=1 Tax=Winmispira thermophila TaxID=154 RepID=UPI0002F2706F|nr:nitroreductase family protein [Spirochaeta thermophila]
MEPKDDVIHWILSRRSVRRYRPEEVPAETIRLLLKAAMAAPSAVGKDPWRFIVMRDEEVRTQVSEGLPNGKFLAEAPLGIAVCGDLQAAHAGMEGYLVLDCAAAIENLLLAASGLGLGACWLGVYPRKERMDYLREVFSLPGHIVPVACIALGYPAEEKEPRTRYREEYVHWDRW